MKRRRTDRAEAAAVAEERADEAAERGSPFRAWFEFNNYQPPAVGAERGLIGLEDLNVTGFGDALTLTDEHKVWWSYVGHFLHTPGYVYAYAFGNLLALSVYHRYLERGPDFVDDYLDFLAAGLSGGKSPLDPGATGDNGTESIGSRDSGVSSARHVRMG